MVDPRTVDFVLPSADPTFLTEVLPWIPVFPRDAIEAAYADFTTGTKGLTATGLNELVATITDELSRDPPVCTTRLAEIDDLFGRLGVHLYREDFAGDNGVFDPCWYMQFAADEIAIVAGALGESGLDAVVQALAFLMAFHPFPGTGPYRLVSESADRVHLEAWPGYHGGLAATKSLDFVPARGDGSDLEAGALDVLQGADLGSAFRATAAARGVRVTTPPAPRLLQPHVQRPARAAVRRPCPQTGAPALHRPAAQRGRRDGRRGIAVYGPVLPGSWGDDPALPKPTRDLAAARRLIEGAGWQLGPEGSTSRAVSASPPRSSFGRTRRAGSRWPTSSQRRRATAGWTSRASRRASMTSMAMLGEYPHNVPGTTRQFDLYLGGWALSPDPADGLGQFASSAISDAEHPDNPEYRRLQRPRLRPPAGCREHDLRPGRAGTDLPPGTGGTRSEASGHLPLGGQQHRQRPLGGGDRRRTRST